MSTDRDRFAARFALRMGGQLALTLATSGMHPADIDTALDWPDGHCGQMISSLLDGDASFGLGPIADIATVTGHSIALSLVSPPVQAAETATADVPDLGEA